MTKATLVLPAALSVAITFVACGDGDDPEPRECRDPVAQGPCLLCTSQDGEPFCKLGSGASGGPCYLEEEGTCVQEPVA